MANDVFMRELSCTMGRGIGRPGSCALSCEALPLALFGIFEQGNLAVLKFAHGAAGDSDDRQGNGVTE